MSFKRIASFSFIVSLLIITVSVAFTIKKSGIVIKNDNKNKTITVVSEITPFNTEYIYNASRPSSSDPIVIKDGITGLRYTYNGIDYVELSSASNQILEVGTKEGQSVFQGRLTGYGPDCPGCSIEGYVSCALPNGSKYSLITDGIYYNDPNFGQVRILAASHSKFPCGTIVKVENSLVDSFIGIVLDSGSAMRNAWNNGIVWMDLAFSSQNAALEGGVTSSNTTFKVQRWGF